VGATSPGTTERRQLEVPSDGQSDGGGTPSSRDTETFAFNGDSALVREPSDLFPGVWEVPLLIGF
jgi:hypothetical protein